MGEIISQDFTANITYAFTYEGLKGVIERFNHHIIKQHIRNVGGECEIGEDTITVSVENHFGDYFNITANKTPPSIKKEVNNVLSDALSKAQYHYFKNLALPFLEEFDEYDQMLISAKLYENSYMKYYDFHNYQRYVDSYREQFIEDVEELVKSKFKFKTKY